MSDGIDPATPPQDTGLPDAVERDPAALNSAEDLDEDRLRLDPLEEGMDPPEHWSQADRYGNTPYEQSHGQDLEHRLREEEPDISPDGLVDEAWQEQVDENPDDLAENVERVPPEDEPPRISDAVRRGQSADEAGGSVAEAIRTPPDRPM